MEYLKKYRDEHPEGTNVRHGSTCRHFRARYSDARTVQGKALRAVLEGIVDDLGGESAVTVAQRLILARVKEKLISLDLIGKWLDHRRELLVSEAGEVPPVLRGPYLTLSDSMRKDLEVLYNLASKRPTPRELTLDEYLKKGRSGE